MLPRKKGKHILCFPKKSEKRNCDSGLWVFLPVFLCFSSVYGFALADFFPFLFILVWFSHECFSSKSIYKELSFEDFDARNAKMKAVRDLGTRFKR